MELDLRKQKRRLLEKKAELEQSMADLTEAHPTLIPSTEADGGDNDREDQAIDAEEMEDEKIIYLNEQNLLTLVNNALQRLEDGTYGLCLECGEPIEPARLEALPWAERSTHCEALIEQRRGEA